jgi:hypothetical protein
MRLFNVSKTRAAVVAILCFIAGFSLLPLGVVFFPVYGGMFAWSLIYGCIWFYKFNRDQKIVAQQKAAAQLPVEAEQSMTTPNSSHLYVPRPIDHP